MNTDYQEDIIDLGFRQAIVEQEENLKHAKLIQSEKTEFWYKLNDLIGKIKAYKNNFTDPKDNKDKKDAKVLSSKKLIK